jgi:hypothetical protein
MIRIVHEPASTADWHAGFLALLPAITRQAWIAFRQLKPEARQNATEEVIANAMVAYARLVALGKADVAYAIPLAKFGIAQVRDGRKVGSRHSIRDVLSEYAQRMKGFVVERLDRFDNEESEWKETIIEDRHAGPARTAAARIDIGDWFGLLSERDRKIAGRLAIGETTGEVAREFGLSPGRISQLRQEYYYSWRRFHGEEREPEDATVGEAAVV